MLKRKFVFDLQRFAGVVATVKLGNADEKSFTGIKKAFKAINGSDEKEITLTMKKVVSLSSPLNLEIADTLTFKNPDWLVCHPNSNKPTLRVKSGELIIDKVNLEGDRELIENQGVKDNGTAIADGAEVTMYMPIGDGTPAYINMKSVSSARIVSSSDTVPVYFDTFEHAMNHLDENDQSLEIMETADSSLENSVLSYTGSGDKKDLSFKLKGVAKASDIVIGADKNFNITAANFSDDGITVIKGGKYKFNLVASSDDDQAPKNFTGSKNAETVNNYIAHLKIYGKAGADEITNYAENATIYGGAGNDTLSGGKSKDSLYGGDDNDVLYGNAGNDYLNGGKGNDLLSGGKGKDYLYGGSGNDSLWGGKGNDKLYGGSGDDIFIYKPNEGTDTIYDYEADDMLQIVDTKGEAVGYDSATFKSGKLTLEVIGGGKVVFDGVSKGDKININGTIHTVTKNSLK